MRFCHQNIKSNVKGMKHKYIVHIKMQIPIYVLMLILFYLKNVYEQYFATSNLSRMVLDVEFVKSVSSR